MGRSTSKLKDKLGEYLPHLPPRKKRKTNNLQTTERNQPVCCSRCEELKISEDHYNNMMLENRDADDIVTEQTVTLISPKEKMVEMKKEITTELNNNINNCTVNNKKTVHFSEDNYVVLRRTPQPCRDVDEDESTADATAGPTPAPSCNDSDIGEETYCEIPASEDDNLPQLLRPLFFEVPAVGQLVPRHSLFAAVEQRLAVPGMRGVILQGGPATGKTSTILDLVLRSCFGRPACGRQPSAPADRLAADIVGYHFLQAADAAATCDPGRMVHSLAAQLSQHPALAAYRRYLDERPQLVDCLSQSALAENPDRGLVDAVLQPLDNLFRRGEIRLQRAIIVLDSLHEGESLEEEKEEANGDNLCSQASLLLRPRDSVASFLFRHLLRFPHWLKLLVTVDTTRMGRHDTEDLAATWLSYLPSVHLHSELQNDGVMEYIEQRLFSGSGPNSNNNRLFEAVSPVRRPAMAARLVNLLVKRSDGSYLFPRLIIDHLEAGRLSLKSMAMTVLPHNLTEVLHLSFSLLFPSSAVFDRAAADLLAICLASTRPRSLHEVYSIIRHRQNQPTVSFGEIVQAHGLLADLLILRSDGSLMFQHDLIAEWLTGPDAGRFRIDKGRGHDLIVQSLDHARLRDPASVLEFAHHLVGCGLFGTAASPSLSELDLKALYLNFKVDRRELELSVNYLPCSQFAGSWKIRQLLATASGLPL